MAKRLACSMQRAFDALDEEEATRPLCHLIYSVQEDEDGRTWLHLECEDHGAQWRVPIAAWSVGQADR